MKELSNIVSKMYSNLYASEDVLYYYTIHVDESDEERDLAIKQWGAVCGVNKAFMSLALYPTEEKAHDAMLRRLKEIVDVAIRRGYEQVGQIVDEQREFAEWWAYADLTHNGKPIRVWGRLDGVSTI